ncbi:MAG TPA: hypothetical protein VGR71_03875 [Nitrospira sp.]|nr:hypothetical protein [Nitrospira sp.]
MRMRSVVDAISMGICVLLLLSSFVANANAQPSLPESTKPRNVKTQTKQPSESGWPRVFTVGSDTFTIYPPQVDKWNENLTDLYCAVEVKAGKESAAKYGVVGFRQRPKLTRSTG